MQVKGKLFRNKTLFIQEPIFVNDAEQSFGEELDRCRREAVSGITGAAVDLAASQQRLLLALDTKMDNVPAKQRMEVFHILMRLHTRILQCTDIESVHQPNLKSDMLASMESTLRVVEIFCQEIALCCFGSENSPEAIGNIAYAIISQDFDSKWILGVIQPDMVSAKSLTDVTEILSKKSRNDGPVHPKSLLQLLAQLDFDQIHENDDILMTCHALCSISVAVENNLDICSFLDANAALFSEVIKLLSRCKIDGPQVVDRVQLVIDDLILLFLASSKAISTIEIKLGFERDVGEGEIHHSMLQSVSIAEFGDVCFLIPHSDNCFCEALQSMTSKIPWNFLSEYSTGRQRIFWLLSVVSSIYYFSLWMDLHDQDNSGAMESHSSTARDNVKNSITLSLDVIHSEKVWNFFKLGDGNVKELTALDDAKSLMNMVFPEETMPIHVQKAWLKLKSMIALKLYIHNNWPTKNFEMDKREESVSLDYNISSSTVSDLLQRLSGCGEAVAAVCFCVRSLQLCASLDIVNETIDVISMGINSALSVASQHQECIAILKSSVEHCLDELLRIPFEFPENASASDSDNRSQEYFNFLAGILGSISVSVPSEDSISNFNGFIELASLVVKGILATIARSPGGPLKRLAMIASALSKSLSSLPEHRIQSHVSYLFSTEHIWSAVLGAWILDAVLLSHAGSEAGCKDEFDPEAFSLFVSDNGSNAEATAKELMALLDCISRFVSSFNHEQWKRNGVGLFILWYEFFLRISWFKEVLEPLLPQQDIIGQIERTSDSISSESEELGRMLRHLGNYLDNNSEENASITSLVPFIGSVDLAVELPTIGFVEKTWTFEETTSKPKRTTTGSDGDIVNPLPPTIQRETRGIVGFIDEEKSKAARNVFETAVSLRQWIRTSEKAMKIDDETESMQRRGREGETPDPLASAQQQLWELDQRLNDDLGHLNDSLRTKTCQKFVSVDIDQLIGTSDHLEDGQVIPPYIRDPEHNEACIALRARANALLFNVVGAKEIVAAAAKLQSLEHFLLAMGSVYSTNEAKPDFNIFDVSMTSDEENKILISRLQGVLLDTLMNGSSPPGAFEFLTGSIEKISSIGGINMPLQSKLKLVKRLPLALSSGVMQSSESMNLAPRAHIGLPKKYALRLLKACVDPDSLLDNGNLRDFLSFIEALELLIEESFNTDECEDGRPSSMYGNQQVADAISLLEGFDLQRFGMLIAEKCDDSRSHKFERARTPGGESSSGDSRQQRVSSSSVTMHEVLRLASSLLSLQGTKQAAVPLIEGILGFSTMTYYCAIMGIILSAPSSPEKDTLTRMLSSIPMEMLSAPVLAAAMEQIVEAMNCKKISPYEIPFELLERFMSTEYVKSSLHLVDQDAKNCRNIKIDNSGSEVAAWTIKFLDIGKNDMVNDVVDRNSKGQDIVTGRNTCQTSEASPSVSEGYLGIHLSVKPSRPLFELSIVPASHCPLRFLFEEMISAILDMLLFSLQKGRIDANASCDIFSVLLRLLARIPEREDPWGLEWFWKIYRNIFSSFLASADEFTNGASNELFKRCWKSLPWANAKFLEKDPGTISSIRIYLPAADGSAMWILKELDWSNILNKIVPQEFKYRNKIRASNSSAKARPIFTLTDEESEQDPDTVTPRQSEFAAEGQKTSGLSDSKTKVLTGELVALILECLIILPIEQMPEWMASLCNIDEGQRKQNVDVDFNEYVSNLPLVDILSRAEWLTIARISSSDKYAQIPWLLYPALVAQKHLQLTWDCVAERLLRVCIILTNASLKKDQPDYSAVIVMQAVAPLLGLSICQGHQYKESNISNKALPTNFTGRPDFPRESLIGQHEKIIIPPDIPSELLEGTVEAEQVRLQQEQIQMAQGQAPMVQDSFCWTNSSGSMPMFVVRACFRLPARYHVSLLSFCITPLLMHWTSEKDIIDPKIVAELKGDQGQSDYKGTYNGVIIWEKSRKLFQESIGGNKIGDDQECRLETLGIGSNPVSESLNLFLLHLASAPLTIIISENLLYANNDLPWDTETAVYLSNSVSGAAKYSQRGIAVQSSKTLRNLGTRISSVLGRHEKTNSLDSLRLEEIDKDCNSLHSLRELFIKCIENEIFLKNDIHSRLSIVEQSHSWESLDEVPSVRTDCFHQSRVLCSSIVGKTMCNEELNNNIYVSCLAESLLHKMVTLEKKENRMKDLDTCPQSSHGNNISVDSMEHPLEHSILVIDDDDSEKEDISTMQSTRKIDSLQKKEGDLVLDSHERCDKAVESEIVGLLSKIFEFRDLEYFLSLAREMNDLRRPLLTALSLEGARSHASILDKVPWQAAVESVLLTVTLTESNFMYPLDSVHVWLESLSWINDSRWRRLPPGNQRVALTHLLESLDQRVEVVQVLTMDDLSDPSGFAQSAKKMLATFAKTMRDKVKNISDDMQRSRLDDENSEYQILPMQGDSTAVSQNEPKSPTGTMLPLSYQQLDFQSQTILEEEKSESQGTSNPARKFSKGMRAFRRQIGAAKDRIAKSVRKGADKLKTSGDSASASTEQENNVDPEENFHGLEIAKTNVNTADRMKMVRESIPTGQENDSRSVDESFGLAVAPPKIYSEGSSNVSISVEAEAERDALVRTALAAFAISSYIRSVLDPRSARRTLSNISAAGDPSSPKGTFSMNRSMPSHSRGNSSATGSRHFEEAQMKELDCVLEAREWLDVMADLSQAPLVSIKYKLYEEFFDAMPSHLSVGVPVHQFQAFITRTLLGKETSSCLTNVQAQGAIS